MSAVLGAVALRPCAAASATRAEQAAPACRPVAVKASLRSASLGSSATLQRRSRRAACRAPVAATAQAASAPAASAAKPVRPRRAVRALGRGQQRRCHGSMLSTFPRRGARS
jgi:hypothetical protein